MQRRRFRENEPLEIQLSQEAKSLRAEAKLLPPGLKRDEMIRRARQAETGSHMSNGLHPPDFSHQNHHTPNP